MKPGGSNSVMDNAFVCLRAYEEAKEIFKLTFYISSSLKQSCFLAFYNLSSENRDPRHIDRFSTNIRTFFIYQLQSLGNEN